METDCKFKRGDRVQIVSECQSYGQCGVVTLISREYWNNYYYVTVKLDNGHTLNYNEKSLILADEQNNIIKGDKNMLIGNYNVAMVKFLQGTNTAKGYAFALFDDDVKVDDCVLCDTANGYGVAKIIEIIPKSEYEGTKVTKEIICKVDFANYENRKENRTKALKLKSEMDKKIKEMQELAVFEMMAEKNPELKEMLEVYKGLMG